MQCVSLAAFGLYERFSVVCPLLAGGSAIAQESEGGMQCGIWRRKLRFPVLISLTGFGIGGWYGSAIGIAAFGTAISGWLPIGVLRIVSIWLIYYFGKRATVALLKYLKGVAIRGLDLLRRPACRYLAGSTMGAWFGSGIGIAAFGTAISGMVLGAILGLWLAYRYDKRR